jgi:hypothetical protein
MSLTCATGNGTAGVGVPVGEAPVVIGLLLMGFGNGAWDVGIRQRARLSCSYAVPLSGRRG